jgi:hypothetical protein|tara:strand:+ start:194 stop:361 length:168 start_codon:yes stop_codon:yes gene_type:complete
MEEKVVVQDWGEARELVEQAVQGEAERILREGNLSTDAYAKQQKLYAAWRRILNG